MAQLTLAAGESLSPTAFAGNPEAWRRIRPCCGCGDMALENDLPPGLPFPLPYGSGIAVLIGHLLVCVSENGKALTWHRGGAIHPLGTGLIVLGWRDVIEGNVGAWSRWLINFGLATGIYMLWNAGSFLVITTIALQSYASPVFESNISARISIGITLLMVVTIGITASWIGRYITNNLKSNDGHICLWIQPHILRWVGSHLVIRL